MLIAESPDSVPNMQSMGRTVLCSRDVPGCNGNVMVGRSSMLLPPTLVFCNDRMEGPDVDGVTGSEGQQVQPTEAEEKGLRGPTFWEWCSGTDDKVYMEYSGNGGL